jgi:hypothetical protein
MFRTNHFGCCYRVVMLFYTSSGNFEAIRAYQQDALGPYECRDNAAQVIKVSETKINAEVSEVLSPAWCARRYDDRTIMLFKQNLNDATADLAGGAAYEDGKMGH